MCEWVSEWDIHIYTHRHRRWQSTPARSAQESRTCEEPRSTLCFQWFGRVRSSNFPRTRIRPTQPEQRHYACKFIWITRLYGDTDSNRSEHYMVQHKTRISLQGSKPSTLVHPEDSAEHRALLVLAGRGLGFRGAGFTGLLSNLGEKEYKLYFIMVPLRKKVVKYGTPKPSLGV